MPVDPRADQQEEIGFGDSACVHVRAQAPDLDPLHLAELDAREVDPLDAADERVDLLGVRCELPVGAVLRVPVFVVEVMDGVVVDLLGSHACRYSS